MQKAKKLEAKKPQKLVTIVFPDPDKPRARKVVTRSRARATGKFPSRKMNRMLQWESINELNAFRLLEVNPEVEYFQEQPCEIHYIMNEEPCVHYPDILVKTQRHKEFWEIKPAFEAKQPTTAARTKLLSAALPDHGYQYRVVLGEDLARKPRLYNMKALLAYGRGDVPSLLREKVRQIFAQIPEMTIQQLLVATDGEISRKHIYRLIVDGDLWCDIENQLSNTSVLKRIANREQK
jgi:hypothetical protein